ncbi:hypothetical protein HDU76_012176 [Blyttiomyces sp. JEL0837]|nr:hypothetical protein HDU76_012176 [Blyttiomyces sp. JEL0837]
MFSTKNLRNTLKNALNNATEFDRQQQYPTTNYQYKYGQQQRYQVDEINNILRDVLDRQFDQGKVNSFGPADLNVRGKWTRRGFTGRGKLAGYQPSPSQCEIIHVDDDILETVAMVIDATLGDAFPTVDEEAILELVEVILVCYDNLLQEASENDSLLTTPTKSLMIRRNFTTGFGRQAGGQMFNRLNRLGKPMYETTTHGDFTAGTGMVTPITNEILKIVTVASQRILDTAYNPIATQLDTQTHKLLVELVLTAYDTVLYEVLPILGQVQGQLYSDVDATGRRRRRRRGDVVGTPYFPTVGNQGDVMAKVAEVVEAVDVIQACTENIAEVVMDVMDNVAIENRVIAAPSRGYYNQLATRPFGPVFGPGRDIGFFAGRGYNYPKGLAGITTRGNILGNNYNNMPRAGGIFGAANVMPYRRY